MKSNKPNIVTTQAKTKLFMTNWFNGDGEIENNEANYFIWSSLWPEEVSRNLMK